MALTKLAVAAALCVLLVAQAREVAAVEVTEDVHSLPCTVPDTDKEDRRNLLIDPEHRVTVNLGPLKFEIPWAYMHPRPFSTHLNCDPNRKSVGIQYLIPSFDAPQRDLYWRPEYSETKPGGAVEYAVKVTAIKYYSSELALDEATTDKRIQKLLRRYGESAETTDNNGISTISSPPAPPDSGYWFARRDKESLLIWCLPDAYCQGHIDLKERNLHVHLLLPEQTVPKHELIVLGLRTLLDRWTLPN